MTEFTHNGSAIVLGDLLGLNNDANDNVSMSSSPSLNNDLAGLDLNFTTTQPPVTDGVVRRSRIISNNASVSTEAQPPGGKRSNNRAAIVEDDSDCLDFRQSVILNDHMLSHDDNMLTTISKEKERQCTWSSVETSRTMKDAEVAENETGRVCVVPQRTENVLLRSKQKSSDGPQDSLISSSTVCNVRPVLLPKPRQASIKRQAGITSSGQSIGMMTSLQSPVLTSGQSTGSMANVKSPVSDVEWKLLVEQLNIKLELVERERDVTLARVKELEQELQTYRATHP